jgi:predicted Zn-dependent peptidase
MKTTFSAALLVCWMAFSAAAQMPPQMIQMMSSKKTEADLPTRDRPLVMTLDNGMQFILIENHASPVIASTVVVRTGSRNESIELCGATHFLEHLLFNGTETRTQKQLYDEMDFLGGYNNANTTYDHTNFMILLEKSNFEKGLEIQADMLFHSTLPPEKFEKEKGIVIEEIGKDEDNEGYRVEQFFNRVQFAGTPYQWPILGSRRSINRLTREQVWDYYKTYYVPNNMVGIVIGDFNTPDMVELIDRVFGAEEPNTLPEISRLKPPVFPRGNSAENTYIYQGKGTTHHLRRTIPAPTRTDEDYHAFLVMMELLQKDLDRILVEGKTGVTDVSVGHFVDRDFAFLNVDLTIDPSADLEKVQRSLSTAMESFRTRRFDAEEVQAVITALRSEDLFYAERPHFYGMLKSDDLAQAGPYFLLRYQEALSAVTPDDIQRIARDHLTDIGTMTAVYEAVKDVPEGPAGEKPANIIRRQFPNGMTVIVQQDRSNPIFATHFLFKHRSAYETMLDGKTGMVNFLHHLLDYGPEKMEKEEFQAELQKAGAKVKFYDMAFIPYDDYYTTPEFSYVRLEVLDDNYIPVLKLISQDLMHLKIDPESVESVRKAMITTAKKNQNSIKKKGARLFKSLLYGDSPLAADITGDPEDIASFNERNLDSFSRLYFSPENLILTILTSLNPEDVMNQVKSILGSWNQPSPLPAVSYPAPGLEPARKEISGGKKQSYLAMGYSFAVADPADKAPLAILNALLSNRMQFQLREREGLAYTLGSSVRFYGDWGVWYATMGTSPQNLERAEAGIIEEIERALNGGFDREEVTKARNAYLGRQAMRTLTRANRAYYMGLAELHGKASDQRQKWIGELQKVTVEDLERVAPLYLKSQGLTVAIVR